MDPIRPVSARTTPVQRPTGVPVERLERVSRERDRPSHERPPAQQRPRTVPEDERDDDGFDEGGPHVDVRA